MGTKCRERILAALAVIFIPQVCPAETPVSESAVGRKCLSNYSQMLDRLQHSYVEYEASASSMGTYDEPYAELTGKVFQRHFAGSLALDGERYSHRNFIWGNLRSSGRFQPREQAGYESILWRPDYYHQYNRGSTPGFVITSTNRADFEQHKRIIYEGKYVGQFMLGYLGEEVSPLRLDTLLNEKTSTVTSGDDQGSNTIKISSKGEFGEFTAYFGAGEPHNLLRVETLKKPGDTYYKEPLPADNKVTCRAEFSDFIQVDGITVPTSGTAVVYLKLDGVEYRQFEHTYKASRVSLDPDFEKLEAFEPNDIALGAESVVLNQPLLSTGRPVGQ